MKTRVYKGYDGYWWVDNLFPGQFHLIDRYDAWEEAIENAVDPRGKGNERTRTVPVYGSHDFIDFFQMSRAGRKRSTE